MQGEFLNETCLIMVLTFDDPGLHVGDGWVVGSTEGDARKTV